MNAPLSASLLSAVELAPRDPILGVTEAFVADTNPKKLNLGADFLRKFAPGAQVWISDPSWENHRALFEGAGFTVNNYAYYDPATRGLAFPAMVAALERLPQGSIVVLHACCHNPTGVDP